MAKSLELMYFWKHALFHSHHIRKSNEERDTYVTFSGNFSYNGGVLLMETSKSLLQCSDEELMDMFRLGDSGAFEVLYARHAPRVFGYLKKRAHSEQMAKDVFQDTFLKLHRTRGKYNSKKNFSAWLFTLCRHAMIDAYRAQSESKNIIEFVDANHACTQEVSSNPNSDGISTELLSTLTPRERDILQLRFERDLSFNSISEILGLSLVNVRKIASRAVKRLRGAT